MSPRLLRLCLALCLLVGLFTFAAPAAASGPPAAHVANEVLVQFAEGSSAPDRDRAVGNVGGSRAEVIRGSLELVRLAPGRLVADAVRGLAGDRAVAFAEPNWIYTHGATSNDTYYTNGSLWGMYGDGTSPPNQYGSQAGEAWAAESTGSDIVHIGVIDEGIDISHPDLNDNIWTNPYDPVNGVDDDGNGYVDDIHGWDFVNNDNTVYDGRGRRDTSTDAHGTHVAGTIGGEGGNGTGVVGVNWNVTIISAKFLGKNGGTTANAIRAVDYITDLKTRHGLTLPATNNSWGGGGFSEGLFLAIERANAAGILFVAAAGNGGSDGVGDNNEVTPHYPSSYTNDNVIAVAALASNGTVPSWSNYGAVSVDLGAPGAGIYSTTPKNGYKSFSGTSMATPHVTGGAALYASIVPGATAADIKAAILASTVSTPSLTGRTVTGGRLNVSGFVVTP